jgi:hypothetical protein
LYGFEKKGVVKKGFCKLMKTKGATGSEGRWWMDERVCDCVYEGPLEKSAVGRSTIFTAYDGIRGTRGQLVEVTVEVQLTEIHWRPGWFLKLAVNPDPFENERVQQMFGVLD